MTDKEDLRGSRCGTLTNDQRAHIEQADNRSKENLTVCSQYRHRWDSDDYLARSVGTLFKTVHPPDLWEGVEMRLDWCNHGHMIHYFLNGYHIAHRPAGQVTPQDYLESIWSAGRAIAIRYMEARQEEEFSS